MQCCNNILKCVQVLFYDDLNICDACHSHYTSDNDIPICLAKGTYYCGMKTCKSNNPLADVGKFHLIKLNEHYICMKCFVKHGGTRKQINRAIEENNLIENAMTDGRNYDILYINNYALNFNRLDDKWLCTDKMCNHPQCISCKNKHLFLLRVKLYEDKINMCSNCWMTFNEL